MPAEMPFELQKCDPQIASSTGVAEPFVGFGS